MSPTATSKHIVGVNSAKNVTRHETQISRKPPSSDRAVRPLVADFQNHFPAAEITANNARFNNLTGILGGTAESSRIPEWELPLDIQGTAFQSRGWGVCCERFREVNCEHMRISQGILGRLRRESSRNWYSVSSSSSFRSYAIGIPLGIAKEDCVVGNGDYQRREECENSGISSWVQRGVANFCKLYSDITFESLCIPNRRFQNATFSHKRAVTWAPRMASNERQCRFLNLITKFLGAIQLRRMSSWLQWDKPLAVN